MNLLQLKTDIENRFEAGDSDNDIAHFLNHDTTTADLIGVIRIMSGKSIVAKPKLQPKPVRTCKEAAKQIEQAAKEWKQHGEKAFPNEPEMTKVYEEDATDLMSIVGLLRDGDKKVAAEAANDLDTIVREQIPTAAWDYLQSDMH